MDLARYKEYLIPTVEVYNKKIVDKLISVLIDKQIIIDKDAKTNQKKDVIIPEIQAFDNVLIGAIEVIGLPVIKEIERWEYIREYQY